MASQSTGGVPEKTPAAASGVCPHCSSPVDPGSPFCINCGRSLETADESPVPEPVVAPVLPLAPDELPESELANPVSGQRDSRGCCLAATIVIVLGLTLGVCAGGAFAYMAMREGGAWPLSLPFWPGAGASVTPTASPTGSRTPAGGTATATTPTATASRTAPPGPTVTRTSTPRSTATFTPRPSPTATQVSGVLFSDNFASRQASISYGWDLTGSSNVDYNWSAGRLTIVVKRANWLGLTWPSGLYRDVGVETEAQPSSGAKGEYGLVLRSSGTTDSRSYYLFGLTTDGKYHLSAQVAGVWAADPILETPSSAIKGGGAKNIIGAILQGNSIAFYINRTLVKTISNSLVPGDGSFGIYAATKTGADVSVGFTRFTVLTVERARHDWGVAP